MTHVVCAACLRCRSPCAVSAVLRASAALSLCYTLSAPILDSTNPTRVLHDGST